MYTRHKGWPLRGVGVDIMHAKELGADAAATILVTLRRHRLDVELDEYCGSQRHF